MPKKKKDVKRKQLMLLAGLIIVLIILDISIFFLKYYHPAITVSAETTATVINVTDGDTFQIDTGQYVRLIGVNTPEAGFIGYSEAKAFLTLLIEDKQVRLVKDVSETDVYGRLLRYVYVQQGSNEVFVNADLVKLGYAKLMPVPPDTSIDINSS